MAVFMAVWGWDTALTTGGSGIFRGGIMADLYRLICPLLTNLNSRLGS